MEREMQGMSTDEQVVNKTSAEELKDITAAGLGDDKIEVEDAIRDITSDDVIDIDEKQKKSAKLFKNTKSKELAAKDQKIDELTDRMVRTMAEFDNFRKRSDKEKGQMFDLGSKSVIEKLLPVVDNFERGLVAVSEEEKNSAFVKGIEMIYKQMMSVLEEIGVKPIDAVGKEFDPNLHNAVMHGEDETLEANIVSDEFQKGYMYHDMVVRHSMVKVVN
ncbi:MAG TPA: nucleotide exchange factor GrpE [Clostridiales bacterium]|nr:nucleotide exchange factor GrpE [Clostridiales bacterium]